MDNIFQNKKIVAIMGGVIILLVGIFIAVALTDMNNNKIDDDDTNENSENVNGEVGEEKKESPIDIVDIYSDSRPVAVMINNIGVARNYHSGLQDAYLVYEIIVEGGLTRLMAVYKDKEPARIGSVRSSRHYYLDYALENDAIYVHFGWSPQAESDISTLGINNINGLYDEAFWRDNTLNVAYEHTAYTSMKNIMKVANQKKYSLKSTKDLLLNYSEEDLDLSSNEDSKIANSVNIKYSNSVITNYIYNSEDKLYYRSVNDKAHKDYVTKNQYTTKNIIIAYASNSYISNDSKGRQELNNIGSGEGYYITNGVAVPITWEKSSRKAQTVYKYKNGDEIVVNDGNTYIQIAPLNSATIK